MKPKLDNISGQIAAASFIAKMNGDDALSKMLLEIIKDVQSLATE